MLAVERGNMNHLGTLEHHYSDPNQPFGFVFGPPDDPAPAPDAPAAGEPLLNDYELSSNNQFFERIQNDGSLFDDKLFEAFDTFTQESLPNFQGMSTSLNHPFSDTTLPVHTLDFTSIGTDNLTSRFGQTQLSSPTVGEHPGQHHLGHFSQPTLFGAELPKRNRGHSDLFGAQDLFQPPKSSGHRSSFHRQSVPSIRHDSLSLIDRPNPPSKHASIQFDSADAIIDSDDPQGRRRPIPTVSFGSDANFSGQKYAAPGANLKDLRSREAMIQVNLATFEQKWDGSMSAAAKIKRRLSGAAALDSSRGIAISHDDEDDEDDDEQPMKKAKKVRHDDDDNSTDDGNGARPGSASRARPKNKARTFSDGPRRKSQIGDAKAARQNLTEEEKKQNHIRSEQKRRNQIKEGFTNLVEIMPDNNVGASKCAILSQAVDWLSGLIEGNQQLRAQLESMG